MTRRQFKEQRKARKHARAKTMSYHRKLIGTKRGVMNYEQIGHDLLLICREERP